MFDIFKFLSDRRIEHTTSGARAKKGWVQIRCPFCGGGSRGYDLGINVAEGYGNCWLCKGKSLYRIIKTLTRSDDEETVKILKRYEINNIVNPEQPAVIKPVENIKLPMGSGSLTDRHNRYLSSRNFDPDKIRKQFDLCGTGPIGPYRHRIVAPIYLDRQLVSYQCRDISGKSELRYKACKKEDEIVHHKHTLYNIDNARSDSCLVVEGVTDNWRMGHGAVATLGTGYKAEQLSLLCKRFKKVNILFDPGVQAQAVADQLAWELEMRGVETFIFELDGCDPGELPQNEADYIMKQLGLLTI